MGNCEQIVLQWCFTKQPLLGVQLYSKREWKPSGGLTHACTADQFLGTSTQCVDSESDQAELQHTVRSLLAPGVTLHAHMRMCDNCCK